MSRRKTPHDSYGAYGKYQIEKALVKDFKQEAAEAAAMSSVFVIINEWTSVDGGDFSEVVGASYFESESEAFDHLEDIAESYNTTIEPDSGSFSMSEPSNYISYQEYYIEELNRP